MRSSRPERRAKDGVLRFIVVVVTAAAFGEGAPRAQTPSPPTQVFRSGTELVLVNVVVRDKSGAVVRNLSRDDFSVTEDDKPQTITSFDFEQLDEPLRAAEEAPIRISNSPSSVIHCR